MSWPTIQLPAELLSEVLLYLHWDNENIGHERDPVVDHIHGFAARWISATWVCRSWRDAALHTGRLWTKFSTCAHVEYPDAIRTFLVRAPAAFQLHIYVNYEWPRGRATLDGENANALKHLRPWAPRIKFLSLFMARDHVAEINRFLGTLGPVLETLAIGFGGEAPPGSARLNIAGFQGLRRLNLRCVPTGNALLPNVTDLRIYDAYRGDPWCLMEFLTTCPGLEVLEISQGFPHIFRLADPANLPVIHLPRLRLFNLNGEHPGAARNALEAFRIPPEAALELETVVTKAAQSRRLLRTEGWLRNLLPEKLDDLGAHSCTRALELKVDAHESEALCIDLWGDAWEDEVDGQHWSIIANYEGGVEIMARHRYFRLFILTLPQFVDSARMARLQLHFAEWLPVRRKELWHELFDQFPALCELFIGEWECIEATTRTLESDFTLLPALDVLRLCIHGIPDWSEAGAAMVRWLKARHEEHTDLGRLEIEFGPDVSPEAETWVRAFLSEVEEKVPSLETELLGRNGCFKRRDPEMLEWRVGCDGDEAEDWGGWASSEEESEPEEESESDDSQFWSASESSDDTDEEGEEDEADEGDDASE